MLLLSVSNENCISLRRMIITPFDGLRVYDTTKKIVDRMFAWLITLIFIDWFHFKIRDKKFLS